MAVSVVDTVTQSRTKSGLPSSLFWQRWEATTLTDIKNRHKIITNKNKVLVASIQFKLYSLVYCECNLISGIYGIAAILEAGWSKHQRNQRKEPNVTGKPKLILLISLSLTVSCAHTDADRVTDPGSSSAGTQRGIRD